jgi:hypothetical protein
MTESRYYPAQNAELRRYLRNFQGIAVDGEMDGKLLKASRPVYRFSFGDGIPAVIGKFFSSFPPLTPADRGLVKEYHAYLQAPALGLAGACPRIPRLLGRRPHVLLGLLLEDIPGPDLDFFLVRAASPEGLQALCDKLQKLAQLLAFFHLRPQAPEPVSPDAALKYFHKLIKQLVAGSVLTQAEERRFQAEGAAWERIFPAFPDRQVLVHGDATPTNFLFPDGRAVGLDLERLRVADRLFDLSWLAGEIKHAWGWRFHDFAASEPAIGYFFRAYFQAIDAGAALINRILRLNPFYMALAELRIARNDYLAWEYRRALIQEALNCLRHGRLETGY